MIYSFVTINQSLFKNDQSLTEHFFTTNQDLIPTLSPFYRWTSINGIDYWEALGFPTPHHDRKV